MTSARLIPIALAGAVFFGSIIAWVCHSVFDMALETALVIGAAIGVADFLMVK